MFMTTTLAHYQLPLQGAANTALQTEIGADQRSLFLRPISSIGVATELPPAEVIQAIEKVTVPMEFKQWMRVLHDYESAASSGNGQQPEMQDATHASQPVPAQPATEPDSPQTALSEAPLDDSPAPAEPVATAPIATESPPEPAAETEPAKSSGGLIGALLGK